MYPADLPSSPAFVGTPHLLGDGNAGVEPLVALVDVEQHLPVQCCQLLMRMVMPGHALVSHGKSSYVRGEEYRHLSQHLGGGKPKAGE